MPPARIIMFTGTSIRGSEVTVTMGASTRLPAAKAEKRIICASLSKARRASHALSLVALLKAPLAICGRLGYPEIRARVARIRHGMSGASA